MSIPDTGSLGEAGARRRCRGTLCATRGTRGLDEGLAETRGRMKVGAIRTWRSAEGGERPSWAIYVTGWRAAGSWEASGHRRRRGGRRALAGAEERAARRLEAAGRAQGDRAGGGHWRGRTADTTSTRAAMVGREGVSGPWRIGATVGEQGGHEARLKRRDVAAAGHVGCQDFAARAHGELRVRTHPPIRIFYAFDPRRTAILLIGGHKTHPQRFYEEYVERADRIYDQYLREIERERQQGRDRPEGGRSR